MTDRSNSSECDSTSDSKSNHRSTNHTLEVVTIKDEKQYPEATEIQTPSTMTESLLVVVGNDGQEDYTIRSFNFDHVVEWGWVID